MPFSKGLGRFLLTVFLGLCPILGFAAEDSVKVKILAVNPSGTKSLKTTVSQYLPPEVTPEDVIDKADLSMTYDPEKKAYILKADVELKPQETKTFEIKIRNVWVVSPEKIEEVKKQVKESADALSGTRFAETSKLLFERAQEALAQIEESQTKPIGITQKIELYRLNIKQLEDIKQNALSLEAMRGIEEEVKSGIREVKFFITAENPAAEERKLMVRTELPRDVQAKDVLEKSGFELLFDNGKQVFALQKEDTLGPKEIKKYQIALRDIWYIPQSELDFLKSETEKLVPLFKGTPYEAFSLKQQVAVNGLIQDIKLLQSEVEASVVLEDRIRAHVLNDQRLHLAKRKIKELQDLLSEVPLKSSENELLEELKQLIKKIAELKKLVIMAMGLDPRKSIVWWLFFGIVLFLALFTAIFYSVWLKKLQENKWVKSQKDKDAKPQTPNPPEKTS